MSPTCTGTPAVCNLDLSSGISSVTRIATGTYCITVPGVTAAQVRAVTTTVAMVSGGGGCANPADLGVLTMRPNANNTANVFADDIGFTIVVP